VLYFLREHESQIKADNNTQIKADSYLRKSASNLRESALRADVAASFQQAVIDVLVEKTLRAAKEYKAKSVMISGGVAANSYLTTNLKIKTESLGLKFFAPAREFVTDNAAMIAASAYIDHLTKKKYRLTAQSNLDI
jgi:tRNA A37 threonylcarbamoyltransferase TsaD